MNNEYIPVILNNDITSKANYTEVLRITQNGFIYKGALIEDAGKAYEVWMEVMEQMARSGGDV
jgi:tRNA-dihydrouridine synthase